MINRIHTFSIGLLFSKHPVLLGEQNEREEITSVFNFKEFIYWQSETNLPESPSFLTVRCWIKPVLTCKQPDIETQTLKRQEEIVTGEERKIRNSFRKWKKTYLKTHTDSGVSTISTTKIFLFSSLLVQNKLHKVKFRRNVPSCCQIFRWKLWIFL